MGNCRCDLSLLRAVYCQRVPDDAGPSDWRVCTRWHALTPIAGRIRQKVEGESGRSLNSKGKGASHWVGVPHEKGAVSIGLYIGHPSRATKMSNADLVIVNDLNGATCIIEVKDKDVMPKNLFGIVRATFAYNIVRHENHNKTEIANAPSFVAASFSSIAFPLYGCHDEAANLPQHKGLPQEYGPHMREKPG